MLPSTTMAAEAAPRPKPPLFRLERVSKSYPSGADRVAALRDVSITIGDGTTAVVGPSGQGKTTLLNLIGAIDAPNAGRVQYRGTLIPYHDEQALRNYRARCVAWIFQDLNLCSHLSALDNVALPLLLVGEARTDARRWAAEHLEKVGIDHQTARRHPNSPEFSGAASPRGFSRDPRTRAALGSLATSATGS